MWAALLLQTSVLTQPLYLDPALPPLRTAKHILLLDSSAPESTRSREETIKLAGELVLRLRGGTNFDEIAHEYSQNGDPRASTILGTFAPEMLSASLDKFLFSAAVGDLSEPLEAKAGVYILQRVETHAAVLQIQVAETGEGGRARCLELRKALEQGADFAELAHQHSADKSSAARGGQFAIYERGRKDTLLKQAAFELEIGEVSAPIESSVGWHLLKRVAIDGVDPALATPSFVRLRAILVRFDTAVGADRAMDRTQEEARKLVDSLHKRIEEGADMRKLAREFDDDPGGKEREGDLGWIYRYAPNLAEPLRQAILLPPGSLTKPTLTNAGYLILKREK
jgi:parvulin-like peptidyl-prolyl isomerase